MRRGVRLGQGRRASCRRVGLVATGDRRTSDHICSSPHLETWSADRRAARFTQVVTRGENRLRLTQTLGRRALQPGRYRLTVRVIGPGGRRSAPLTQVLTLVG
jgi:hypothetical protein